MKLQSSVLNESKIKSVNIYKESVTFEWKVCLMLSFLSPLVELQFKSWGMQNRWAWRLAKKTNESLNITENDVLLNLDWVRQNEFHHQYFINRGKTLWIKFYLLIEVILRRTFSNITVIIHTLRKLSLLHENRGNLLPFSKWLMKLLGVTMLSNLGFSYN